MKIHILNIQNEQITTIDAETPALAELELRYKYTDSLLSVPVGELDKCIEKLNRVSYLSIKKED